MLGHLDKLERHPSYYTRTLEEFEIILSNEETINQSEVINAGIYLLKNFKEELLELPFLECYDGTIKPYVKP